MTRIYISGPMTGRVDLNFNEFNANAERLRGMGYDVVNPAELNPEPGKAWGACMRVDMAALITCDAIAVLPGWRDSRGAQLEAHIARQLGMRVMVASEVTA